MSLQKGDEIITEDGVLKIDSESDAHWYLTRNTGQASQVAVAFIKKDNLHGYWLEGPNKGDICHWMLLA